MESQSSSLTGPVVTDPEDPPAPPGVLLVSMPWAPMIQPSLALGLLQAELREAGADCTTLHANLDFTSRIGAEAYRTVIGTRSSDGLRDWTFAGAAFPDFHPDHEAFLSEVHRRLGPGTDPASFALTARRVREAAGTFTEDLAGRIAASGTKIVGCTSSMNQHVASLALLRLVRERSPDTITLLGGANCEGSMGGVTHELFPWVDFLVSGEADGIIVPLVELIGRLGRDVPAGLLPVGVLGPAHRTGGGVADPGRACYDRLDDLPLPSFDDWFRTLDRQPPWLREMILPSLPMETSRGCWWGRSGGCAFCGIDHAGRGYVSKSPERALREMDALEARHPTGRIQTVDNVMDPAYYDTLLVRLAESPRPYRLFYEVRPDPDDGRVRRLADAGIRWIWAGIESLDSRILRLARKGLAAWENVCFLRACRERGIFVGWNLMCGFPGEEDDWYAEMAATLALCAHLQPPAACVPVRLDRFSDYHRRPDAWGLSLRPASPARFVYPMTGEQLARQVYFFEDPSLAEAGGDRPGIGAVRGTVERWRCGFFGETPPRLEMSDDGEVCRVTDTRPVTLPGTTELTGDLRRAMLLAGGRAVPVGGFPRGLDDAVEALEETGLVLRVDDRVIGLPLRAPVRPIPGLWEYPGGGLVSPAMRRRIESVTPPPSETRE